MSGFSAEVTGVGRIDLTRLCRIFVAVAEYRSFGLAADHLGLSQPSVSQSIRRFESQTGFEVFRRARDGALLTDEGRRLLPLARVLVRDVESFELAATQLASDRDSISIGIGLSAPPWVAAAAARAASSLATRVGVERATDPSLIEKVEVGELSAAIVEFPSPLGDLVKGVGHHAERWLAVPEGRASAASTRTPWSEISGLDLAITGSSDFQWGQARSGAELRLPGTAVAVTCGHAVRGGRRLPPPAWSGVRLRRPAPR